MTESIAEKNLSKEAQKMLKDMRGSRTDMDFMVADFENGDNAKDILAQSDKEFTVIFSKEEMEKMASDPKYYAEKMHSIEGALRMSDEINAQFGFERAFGKTNGIENSADTDTKITKFGISFNSDGTTTFFAQLEKTSASQKEYLEKIINIASPLLNIIYPIVIILIVLSIFNIQNNNVYLLSILGTFIISILKLLHNITSFPHFISKLPLYNVNLEWLPISIIFGIIGMFIKNKEQKGVIYL